MSKVYSWAWRTLVWLGEVEAVADGSGQQLLRQSLSEVRYSYKRPREFYTEPIGALNDLDLESLRQNLMVLLSSTWFTRIWVVQEFALSHHISLYYGSIRIHRWVIDHLSDIFRWLSRSYMLDRMPARVQSSLRNCNAMSTLRQLGERDDLFRVLYAQSFCSEFNCTDSRDRIYALFGFLGHEKELPFQPDYESPVTETYRMLAAACLKQGLIVSLLSFAGLREEPGNGIGNDDYIPSWCPTHQTTTSNSRYLRMHFKLTLESSAPRRVQHQALGDQLRIWGRIDGDAIEDAGLIVDGSRYGASALDMMKWIQDHLSIPSPNRGDNSNRESAQEILARLMSFDSSLFLPFSTSLEAFKDWHNFVNIHQPSSRCFFYPSGQQHSRQQSTREVEQVASKVGHYGTFFQDAIHDHRLCLTTAGRFGVFPRLSQVGDVTALIPGLSLPLALRPVAREAGEQQYLLVGAAFVLDLPNLPCETAEDESTWIVLV
ncbi:hypothetical protein V8F06_007110 [Rhypophila decipiens]